MPGALINGRTYTLDPTAPWAQAVLIEDGVFSVDGSDEEVRSAASKGTELIDLQGKTAMPGLHNAHTHLLFSGLKFKFEARLAGIEYRGPGLAVQRYDYHGKLVAHWAYRGSRHQNDPSSD